MEIQTTIPHGHETKPTEFCPFQIQQQENVYEYAGAETYQEFVTMLSRIFNKLDLGQAYNKLPDE